ncbi:MAG: hypothetical protein JXA21_23605 [Anaerolineae bacterium]|nr:hypothetical protein [Anaerolineae bacterium]
MITKKWILNGIYLVIALLAFSFSLFKYDNQVWIAAWIGPVFLIRFMRTNKWVPAAILGFVVLQIAVALGMIPMIASMDAETNMTGNMDPSFIIAGSVKAGTMFLALLFLVPFVLDKAIYKHLPKSVSHLIFPSGIVAVELFYSTKIGTLFCFGQSQLALPPLVMAASIFGMLGLSFLITWFAPMINSLWEENWDIKKLGTSGFVYLSVMTLILTYGAVAVVFPQKTDKTVPVAGILLNANFEGRLFATGFNFVDPDVKPDEYISQLSSPSSHLQEMHTKTLAAIEAGAKIIIWQEYALTLESTVADTLLQEMKYLADQEDVYLLISYGRILNEAEKTEKIMKNISVLFTPEGETGWEYEKAYPTPGEDLAVAAGSKIIPYLDTPYGRIGQATCFDLHFPQYIRQASVKNIDVLLDPSVDGSAYTPLHTFNAGYRAVENGFTLVRVTGDGYSAVLDPYYRLWSAQHTFEQGTDNFYYNVPVVSKKTVYANIGFIFPYAVVLLLISLIIPAVVKATKKS